MYALKKKKKKKLSQVKLSPRYAWEELGQEQGLKPPPKWQQIQLSTCFFLADNLYKSLSVVAEGHKFAS